MTHGDVAGRGPGEPARGEPTRGLERLLAAEAEERALRRALTALAEAGAALLGRAAGELATAERQRAELVRQRDAAIEEARRTAEEMASRRRTVDQVLGVVGHDLRNPLGAAQMSAALLQRRGGLEGWQSRAVDRMRSSTGRVARIIADLLSYMRARFGGGLPMERRPARLDEIARRAVEELAAAGPGRAIPVTGVGDLAGEWDPDRLEQLVSNLVSDALDHGEEAAPVRVELSSEPETCVLRVCARGPPTPPEVRARLLGPFPGPHDESGSGLGPYVSREIVLGHGGEIGVSSDAGDGAEGETVVTVRLPRRAGGSGRSSEHDP